MLDTFTNIIHFLSMEQVFSHCSSDQDMLREGNSLAEIGDLDGGPHTELPCLSSNANQHSKQTLTQSTVSHA